MPQDQIRETRPPRRARSEAPRPTSTQLGWLRSGLREPGGKLPLYDAGGQRISDRTVRSCIQNGWAEPWFDNPLQPGWLVCRLTPAGRIVAEG